MKSEPIQPDLGILDSVEHSRPSEFLITRRIIIMLQTEDDKPSLLV
jgi:hypothetical protein